MRAIYVGIIGFGTVGAGTYEVLTRNRSLVADRVGAEVVVKRIADLDTESDRGVQVEPGLVTADADEILNDPEIEVVVELIGGVEAAKTYILRAMENGKHVVTANKALLAEHGAELYRAAEEYGVCLAFEASVGGGIPIVDAMKRGLSANHLETLMGILNGTSNYILTEMTEKGLPYTEVVEEAVRRGFAESPPTLDVDGTDAAHKLAVLVSIAYGFPVSFSQVFREGINDLTPDDLRFADEFGYRVKLLAIARHLGDRVEARVHPTMIPKNHILANVNGIYNAVYVEGDFVGPNLYYGMGAGGRPTGSAVVSDIMELAREIRLGVSGLIPPLSHVRTPAEKMRIQPIEALESAYYFRFSALDRPGVLSKVSGILGDHDISLASVIQKGRKLNGSVPLVMLTHEAQEYHVQAAVSRIDRLEVVTDRPVIIRVEDR